MPRFNTRATQTRVRATNLAGGEAYQESPKLELVSILLTSFVQDQFYRPATGKGKVPVSAETERESTLDRLRHLLGQVDPEFAAKAAVYARDKFHMRSVTHMVAAEVGAMPGSFPWRRRFFESVVMRPDDITEVLAYYKQEYGGVPTGTTGEKRMLPPNAMRRGLAAAFSKFDGFQLAKYRGEDRSVKLVDAVNLLHPVPTEKNREALKALVEGTLRVGEGATYERALSDAGQVDTEGKTEEEVAEARTEAKGQAWGELVRSRRIGYFALLRNLRNILEQAPDVVSDAMAMLVDEHLVRRSRLLPFRFVTAAEEIGKLPAGGGPAGRVVVSAIGKACDIAVANCPELGGSTLVVIDGSGSMNGRPLQNACLLGAILARKNNADVVMFSNDARYLSYNQGDSVLSLAAGFEKAAPGSGTNFRGVFGLLTKDKRPYDRVVVLSDMQAWMSTPDSWSPGQNLPSDVWHEYCRVVEKRPNLFSWDLAGYGTLQWPEPQVYCLAGFSESVFDVMGLLEQDRDALVREVEAVQF